jgi:small subunit ribosomal protein S1
MNEDKRELMMELYSNTFRNIKEGDIVKGTIVAFNNKEAVIDIGFKSEGFVSVDEFRNTEELKVDNEIDILIESIEDDEGRLILSRIKAEKLRGWNKLGDTIHEGDIVEGRIMKQVKGGFIVDLDSIEAFLPTSLSVFKGISSNEIMTHTYKFQISKLNKQRRNLILSRREIVQKERELVKDKLWDELKKGEKRKGIVKGGRWPFAYYRYELDTYQSSF